MTEYLRKLEHKVAAWPNISVHPHRFGGKEFLFEMITDPEIPNAGDSFSVVSAMRHSQPVALTVNACKGESFTEPSRSGV